MTHNEETSQTQSRQAKTQENDKQEQEASSDTRTRQKKERLRLVPIWARLLIVLAVLAVSLLGGLITGYALVGEGDSFQILKWETWEQFFEFIHGK
ncbi:DNA-directed RNA polymerase subunit beta [Salibacterium aidingense]|uniref:DNA-directed RNA polymerase subunit beta n=1 Tax=Salibacterium aidingense TaxID=384933 RepID=UPI003BBA4BF2